VFPHGRARELGDWIEAGDCSHERLVLGRTWHLAVAPVADALAALADELGELVVASCGLACAVNEFQQFRRRCLFHVAILDTFPPT